MALTDPLQWAVIAVVAAIFLVWGPKKIPELARSLGLARKELANTSQEVQKVTNGLQNPSAFLDTIGANPQQVVQGQQPQSTAPAQTVQPLQAQPVTGDQAMLETARRLGITTEGKTLEQISQEVLAKAT